MLITSNYDNMGSVKKTVINIAKLRFGQYLFYLISVTIPKFRWFAVNFWYKKELCFGKKSKC